MRKRRNVLYATSALLCFSAAHAEDHAELREAMGDFSGESTRCYIYYSVTSNCIRKQDSALAEKTDAAAQRCLRQSFETGKTAGLSQKAMMARTELDLKEMSADIDNDCINIAVLLNKHAAFCEDFLERSGERLQSIIDHAGGH